MNARLEKRKMVMRKKKIPKESIGAISRFPLDGRAGGFFLNVLKRTGYIGDFAEVGEGVFKKINAKLKYENKKPAISLVERVSKPGRRVYSGKTEIPKVLQGRGTVVLSTSKGIMTGQEAKSKGIGGEVILKIY